MKPSCSGVHWAQNNQQEVEQSRHELEMFPYWVFLMTRHPKYPRGSLVFQGVTEWLQTHLELLLSIHCTLSHASSVCLHDLTDKVSSITQTQVLGRRQYDTVLTSVMQIPLQRGLCQNAAGAHLAAILGKATDPS